MNATKKYQYLRLAFLGAVIYSIVQLPSFAIHGGGPCNAGVMIVGIGFFLTICLVLTFISIQSLLKNKEGRSKLLPKILSILSIFVWGFWTVVSIVDEPSSGLLYFTPLLVITFVTAFFAFKKPAL